MSTATGYLSAPFFVRGELIQGDDNVHRSRDLGTDFRTPALELDAIVVSRAQLPPLLDTPLTEIVDFLVEAGERLALDKNPHMQRCLDLVAATNPLPRRVVENLYRSAPHLLTRAGLMAQIESNFHNPAVLDGWIAHTDPAGNDVAIRAFPPRMVHMLAGNAPAGCIASIAQGAMTKAINLFKMPSSDPFTTVAVLQTMAEIDPKHPVVQSMSAVYWQGGDESIERTIYRPQYFDRIVAWGGGPAINNVIKYLGPGLQLLSFDPKSSISMVGQEVFESPDAVADVAERVAADTTVFNQEACLASRFVFLETDDRDQARTFCAALADRLAVDRVFGSAVAPLPPPDVRDEIEVMQAMDDEIEVFGRFDGRGIVVLSEQPVDFHPSNKISNVVMVSSIDGATRYVNLATQTIGMYPYQRKAELRDRLAGAGAQRICRVGTANSHVEGSPHDAMYPLSRLVHWMADDDIYVAESNSALPADRK
ncbi:acyl-CoA reductase [Nocardia sp. NPDC051750]|uniref:acyl-CoA reductase n=1 Tax=Nocardia sp. NPDC051750 TaxID=3364325 RepID=UPI003793D408